MINKLQTAINNNGGIILIDKAQFFSDDQQRPITIYKVCTRKPETRKKEVLFDTTSMIQVVLYLRDYWYNMTGQEIPTDNEQWNEIKRQKNIVFDSGERRE